MSCDEGDTGRGRSDWGCGSTRSSGDSESAHHERFWAALCGVSSRLLGRVGCWGVWFDTVLRGLSTGPSAGSGQAHHGMARSERTEVSSESKGEGSVCQRVAVRGGFVVLVGAGAKGEIPFDRLRAGSPWDGEEWVESSEK